MLSSAVEAIMSFSFGFHEISEMRSVWPPWTNSNSGGPSAFSSSVYCLSKRAMSHIITLLSCPDEAIRLLYILENRTLLMSLVCERRLNSLVLTLRISHTAQVVSAEPVTIKYWSNGEQSTLIIS